MVSKELSKTLYATKVKKKLCLFIFKVHLIALSATSEITVTAIADVQNNSVNLVVNGKILTEPLVVTVGLLFDEVVNVVEGFRGITISDELQKISREIKAEIVETEFETVRKTSLPFIEQNSATTTEPGF